MVRKISSGVSFLDELLGGGLESDAMTTVYGPAGAGKTTLAMLVAATAAEKGKKVLYIDTEGGFSVERLRQVAKDHKRVLENVFFIRPTSFDDQQKTIEKVSELVTKKNISLIVVDTIAMLYRLERKSGEEFFDMSHNLSSQLARLTEVTRKKNVPVLLINQVYTNIRDGSTRMVGGDILSYCSKVVLEIVPAGQYRRFILHKARSVPQGMRVAKIVESGFEVVESNR